MARPASKEAARALVADLLELTGKAELALAPVPDVAPAAQEIRPAVRTGVLYFGDNLRMLREYIPDASVDLVYLDPPFNSQRDYNVIFREVDATDGATAQIEAFEDTWRWGAEAEATLRYLTSTGEHRGAIPDRVATLIDALVRSIGRNDLTAYLVMMTPRLVELHRTLRPTGSLYLHCDPTASHYLKLVLDALFGPTNFRNEIVWKRTSGHSDAKRYGRVHDVILCYGRSGSVTWNDPRTPYEASYVEQYYRYLDADGRRFMSGDLSASGLSGGGYTYDWGGVTREWRVPIETMRRLEREKRIFYTRNRVPRLKRYLDEARGLPLQDVWSDVEAVRSWHEEKQGYPTQKPVALLERIIRSSTNEGDIVLDPFCGCGTALIAAQGLGRQWIGIDVTHIAIAVMRSRLRQAFHLERVPAIGEPADYASARALALEEDGRYRFQWWALSLVNARPISGDKRKGADHGIDGVITFTDSGGMQRVLVSVKSGHVGPDDVRALRGILERDKAAMGVLVTLQDPTRPMQKDAAASGFYDSELWGRAYPRLQIAPVRQLMKGVLPQLPPSSGPGYPVAASRSKAIVEQQTLPGVGTDPLVSPKKKRPRVGKARKPEARTPLMRSIADDARDGLSADLRPDHAARGDQRR